MAIKISGTTVIDNSQNITNAGIVTATSFTGDGSQLTNLPGGGGNTLEATASGTLADGSKVIINTDGTVSVVAETETTGPGAGTPEVFESANTNYISAAYDSTNSKVVIAYEDTGNSGYGTAIVGTVSGTSISFGSPVVFESAIARWTSTTYDSVNQKVVIAYHDDGNQLGKAIVGTVSGTSISFGTAATFQSSESVIISATYDSANEKVIIAYREGSANYGHAVVGTVSGTSISFGTPVVFNAALSNAISATYDSANEKVVISYRDGGNSNYGTAIVGTVSGTSISFGSEVVFNAANTTSTLTFDSANNKVVIAYKDGGNSNYGTAIVGTVSGTSISFGSPTVFTQGNTTPLATYDSTNQKVVIAYRDAGNSDYGKVIEGTVSGTSISFGTPVLFDSTSSDIRSVKFDSTNGKVVIVYIDNGNSNYGTAAVFSNTGFPVAEIGSSAVYNSAGTYYSSAVYDSTNEKVVIAYGDGGNMSAGTAIVGTVSGTSISFGTPVVFNSGATHWISTVYDSANQKVVIAYKDTGNGSYGTAVVGTVSGTSISFGSEVVFRSANISYTSAVYDSANGKIVVAYQDGGNSDRGYTSVLTVSGTSITYGSYRQFESGRVDAIATAYDSTNEKVVIAYLDGGNSDYGTAVVATISGTENTFGTPVVFESAYSGDISATFDSSNNKVVITYKDGGNSYAGTAVVGTVSGTSISFGTPVVFASSPNGTSVVYNSSEQKVVIIYGDASQSSDYGTAIVGTVSGTSISFGSPFVFNSNGSTYYYSATYDSTNNKIVPAYMDYGNSGYGTAIVFTPFTISRNLTAENFIGVSDGAYTNGQTATIQLTGAVDDAQSGLTPGQSYYVQNDGTLSETADSPSVFAGTALASTKLIVRG